MKTKRQSKAALWIVIGLALAAFSIAVADNGVSTIVKTVTTNTVPERLTTNAGTFSRIVFHARASARSTNSGAVYLQWISTNDTAAIIISANGQYTLDAMNADMRQLTNIWVDVETSGDGVVAVVFE